MSKKLRLIILPLSALILLLCAGLFLYLRGSRDGVSTHGALHTENGKLIGKKGENVVLRGYSTHGIAWFGEYINREAFLSVKKAGGNVMRAAMYTEAYAGYLEDRETNLALVNSAIEIAKDLDMYIIVDWHILEDGDPGEYTDKAMEFFSEISRSYPNDPAVIYEICNEPNGVSWEAVCEYADAVIPVIRENSPDALIIVGTPSYSSALNSAIKWPLDYPNLMYAYHYYAGQHNDFEALRVAIEKNLPVFVSEWGINEDENGAPALDDGEAFAEYLSENGISNCVWSLCNKDEVFSALKPECTKLGGWEDDDLTEVGKLMFKYLKGGKP